MNDTKNDTTAALSGSDFAKRCMLLRFLLAVLIVAVHSRYSSYMVVEKADSFFNAHFFRAMPHTAVSFFFLMSGFFLTWKLKPSELFSYRDMLKKKAVSLALPYLLWNTLWGALYFIVLLFPESRVLPSFKFEDMGFWSLLLSIYGRPVDYPLWFIRDLLLFFLLSPCLLWLIDRIISFGGEMDRRFFREKNVDSIPGTAPSCLPVFRVLGIAALLAGVFALRLVPILGSIRFFVLGMVYGRFRNRLTVLDRCWPLVLVLFLGQGFLPFEYFSWEVFLVSSLPAYYVLGGLLTRCNEPVSRLLTKLGNDSFWIFCLHAPIATTLTRIVVKYRYFHIPQIICYLSVIAVTVLICVAVLRVAERLFPRFVRLLNGGRGGPVSEGKKQVRQAG